MYAVWPPAVPNPQLLMRYPSKYSTNYYIGRKGSAFFHALSENLSLCFTVTIEWKQNKSPPLKRSRLKNFTTFIAVLTQPRYLSIFEVKGTPSSKEPLGIWVKKWNIFRDGVQTRNLEHQERTLDHLSHHFLQLLDAPFSGCCNHAPICSHYPHGNCGFVWCILNWRWVKLV